MKYDFDTLVDRRNTNSLKWDVAKDELPMWVADMDFKTAPEIISDIHAKAEEGIFGYSIVPNEWYDAYIQWWSRRHNLNLKKEWLLFCTGIIPAISSIIRKLTTVGENIIVQTPVYNIFFNSIVNNGRRILENPLKYDGEAYEVDFKNLEENMSNPQTTMMILCNPHNTIGKIWDKQTLMHIGQLAKKYKVIVVSDEIHCDLTNPNCEYVPFASASKECKENVITCISPTKTFNLAGLQTAAVTAFTNGEPWLNELREYLYYNKSFVQAYLKKEIPSLRLVPSEATYLLWIDCSNLGGTAIDIARFLRDETGLYISAGNQYGECGRSFIRMNIACPNIILKDGLERLKTGIKAYEKKVIMKC